MKDRKNPPRGRVFVSTESFSVANDEPLKALKAYGFDVALNPMKRRLTPVDYKNLYEGVDYVIAGIEDYSASFFRDFSHIKALSRVGIGLNSIDLAAAKAAKVAVLNTPDAPTQSVAELTFGFLQALTRNLVGMDENFRRGKWAPHLGIELKGETLGLIGFGRIGKTVARIANGYEMKVIAYDPVWDAKAAEALSVGRVELSQLLKTSRFVSLHLPLAENTRHLIGLNEIKAMRKDAFLINTSRGGIIDDEALIACLKEGAIAGAGLDVFEREPDPAHYQNVPNAVFSPHVGSNTSAGRYRMELGAVRNLIEFIETGRAPTWI